MTTTQKPCCDNVLIGMGCGVSLLTGSRNIIIGHRIDVQDPHQSDFVNIGGIMLSLTEEQRSEMRKNLHKLGRAMAKRENEYIDQIKTLRAQVDARSNPQPDTYTQELERCLRLISRHSTDKVMRALAKSILGSKQAEELETDVVEVTDSELAQVDDTALDEYDFDPEELELIERTKISKHTQLLCPNCHTKNYDRDGLCIMCHKGGV